MKKRRSLARRLLRGLVTIGLGSAAFVFGVIVLLRWIDPPTTAFMLRDRIAAKVEDAPGYVFQTQWRDWDEISIDAALAVVAAEDQRFPFHHGFDFQQIDKALSDRRRGKGSRGASTISQQVAKNLFLWPGQSWLRKGLEALLTVAIEATWPKRRILEVYLNIAEFGLGTFGVEAASQRFYRKSATQLSRAEAALLAAVLPAPKQFRVGAASPYVRERQAWIQRQMAALGGPAYLAGLD